MTFTEDASKARQAICPHRSSTRGVDGRDYCTSCGKQQPVPPSLALNPVSGVLHQWWCGLGPARAGAQFADKYVSVPAVVLPSIRHECLCKCLRVAI